MRHPGFKAVLMEPGNVVPGGLSFPLELKPGESLFILQPPYMMENLDAIYFITAGNLQVEDLRKAFKNPDAAAITVVRAYVSASSRLNDTDPALSADPALLAR